MKSKLYMRIKKANKILMAQRTKLYRILSYTAFLLTGVCWTVSANEIVKPVTLFAAASTIDAVQEISRQFTLAGLGKLVPIFAASSTLARQIEQGAPADLVLLADHDWMRFLIKAGLIAGNHYRDLLGNRLVIVVSAKQVDTKQIQINPIKTPPPDDMLTKDMLPDWQTIWAEQLDQKSWLALGDPDHVPAGRYARTALRNLGLWENVKPRIARARDARAALTLVTRGETRFGIVYASDLKNREEAIAAIATIPASCHPPIRYPLAQLSDTDRPEVITAWTYLSSQKASEIFMRFGFLEPKNQESENKEACSYVP